MCKLFVYVYINVGICDRNNEQIGTADCRYCIDLYLEHVVFNLIFGVAVLVSEVLLQGAWLSEGLSAGAAR